MNKFNYEEHFYLLRSTKEKFIFVFGNDHKLFYVSLSVGWILLDSKLKGRMMYKCLGKVL